jgi:hypothetical protein
MFMLTDIMLFVMFLSCLHYNDAPANMSYQPGPLQAWSPFTTLDLDSAASPLLHLEYYDRILVFFHLADYRHLYIVKSLFSLLSAHLLPILESFPSASRHAHDHLTRPLQRPLQPPQPESHGCMYFTTLGYEERLVAVLT